MSLECYGKAWRQALLSNKQIATNIKPETTVVTTEIDRSQPETTTFQQETSMLPACVCTCKILTHILSGYTLEENFKRLI